MGLLGTLKLRGIWTGLVVALWLLLFLMAATGIGAGLAVVAQRIAG